MSRKLFVAATVVALSGTLAVFAIQKDDPAAPGKGAADRPATAVSQSKDADRAMASCVAASNQVEVALGEFASGQSQNEDVKEFAAMLVKDHRDFLQKLAQFAPAATQEGFLIIETKEARATDSKTPGKTRTERKEPPVAAADDANTTRIKVTAGFRPGDASTLNFLQGLEREMAQQCLTSAKEMLQKKSGPEFDQCFVGMQIAMHMGMKDKLIVFQRHASSDLGQLLAAGQKKTEQHLAKAEELMKTLSHDSATSTDTPRDRKNRDREKKSDKE